MIRLWRVMKSGFYMTTGNNQLNSWTEKKLQSTSQRQTCTKNQSWSLFGHLLPIWPTAAFWIPAKPLHLRSMFSKSMRCTENCIVCSQHWFQQKGPNSFQWQCCSRTNTSKAEQIGLQSFASCSIFTWHLVNQLPLIQSSLCRENASTTSMKQKMFSKSSSNPEAWIFMLQG